MKHFIKIIIPLALLLGVTLSCVQGVYAAELTTGFCGENVTYSFDETTHVLTITGTGSTERYGKYWDDAKSPFRNHHEIESVVIEPGISILCGELFYGCDSIQQVQLPEGLIYIVDGAFAGCSSLKRIDFPDSLLSLDTNAFYGCAALSSVTIPVKCSMYRSVFDGCSNLCNIDVAEGNIKGMESRDGILFRRIGDGTRLSLVKYPENKEGDTYRIEGDVTDVESHALRGVKSLRYAVIPTSVKYIAVDCFEDCDPSLEIEYEGNAIDWAQVNQDNFGVRWTHDFRTAYAFHLAAKADIDACRLPSIPDQTWTGSEITFPRKAPRISNAYKRTLATVETTYQHNIDVGTATVTYQGIGDYEGTATVRFNILPPGTKVTKATGGKRKVTVRWQRQAKQTDGYQVQTASDKAFQKSKRTITVKGRSVNSTTCTGLKAKKTYYVRVRTYKTVQGKKYCSAWSKARKVKTK